jgi:hypothetical protein
MALKTCCISCQNWNFRTAYSSLLALLLRNENSVFRWKAKYLRQGKCKQVLSPAHFILYINDAPQTHGVMRQIARRHLLLENSSAVSAQWRHGVSGGISKLMKIRLRGSNVFCLLKTPFRLLTGLFNNLQLGTTSNYNTIAGLHTLQTLLTIPFTLSSVVFTYL